jgi:hypothetical protein
MNRNKSTFYTFLIVALCSAFSMQAATLVVNNASTSPGQYTSITDAMTAAAAGDTILIQGTGANYGNVTVTKPITLRGRGWSPANRPSALFTVLGFISLDAGVHDVTIEGMIFFNLDAASGGQYNIRVQYCSVLIALNLTTNCHDWLIRNNYFFGYGGGPSMVSSATSGSSNVQIQYNVFSTAIESFTNTTNVSIGHNLFIAAASSGVRAYNNMNGVSFANNIFYNSLAIPSGTVNNCTFANNLTYLDGGTNPLPTTGVDGNIVTYSGANLQNTNPLFVTKASASAGFDPDTDNYRLQTASAGKSAGTDGKDVGIYTNTVTFSLTGEPDIPAVRRVEFTNPITTAGGTLIMKITASKANRDGY